MLNRLLPRAMLCVGALILTPPMALPATTASANSVPAITVPDRAVPSELSGWQSWVLKGEEYRRCPLLGAADAGSRDSYRCVWPERLSISVDASGGSFAQRWQIFADGWITLPGNVEHWPREVRANGAPLAVVQRGGLPQARLKAGNYTLSGRFEWSTRPEALTIAAETALVDLTIDGQRVAQPERPQGNLWLGKRRAAAQAAGLEVQVYRLVSDQIPVQLTTLIRVQVAGEGREELLGRALPEGFTPTAINSELVARLEADGRLRVQVRPGSYDITLVARGASVATALKRPALAAPPAPWPRDEIWSFAGDDRLRVAAAEGAEAMDPKQANVPPGWQGLPAFRMTSDATLSVNERSRGLGAGDDSRLSLSRQLWLDFNHQGFTAVDNIAGTLRRDWRLDMLAPFSLASARSGGDNLLVTNTPGVDDKKTVSTGVELRTPNVQLTTIARSSAPGGVLPASGWSARFEQVRGQLHLPPGHRLLAAIGPDAAPGTWWSSWGLWNIFGLCIVVAFTYRVAGRVVAAIALLALVLMYQESPQYIWLWANLLAAIAIARAVPEGRLRRFANGYRNVSVLVMGLALVPMLWTQVRYALYPQLEGGAVFAGLQMPALGGAMSQSDLKAEEVAMDAAAAADAVPQEAGADGTAVSEVAVNAPAAPPPPPAMASPRANSESAASGARRDMASKSKYASVGLNQQQVVQRYAPGTQLQTGPGIPAWSYNSYQYSWSGPVEPTDTARFIFIGPVLLGMWRIAGVVAMGLWFVALLQQGFGLQLRRPWLARSAAASIAPIVGGILLFGLGLLGSGAVSAASTPDTALLNELRTRLTAAPECAPTCVEVMLARVNVVGERLDVDMSVSALTTVAVQVPQAGDRWQIDAASVDGAATLAMSRGGDGLVWLPLRAGAHTVHLSGRVAPVDSLQLAFPQPPRAISVSTNGWTSAGVVDGRLASGSLELTRVRAATTGSSGTAAERLASGNEFPPFVRVVRDVMFDIDWSVTTTVQRIAPDRAALNVAIPLLKGESVLTPGIKVTPDRTALAALPAGESVLSWNSGMARSEILELSLPANNSRIEVWNFSVSPQWHLAFDGFPAVMPENMDGQNWVFQYFPRPGEKLTLRITRPSAAPGATLAIDRVQHALRVGARSSDASVDFSYRSTEGGRHAIKLPPDARVQNVSVDGNTVPLRPENGELSLGLLPGAHRVTISWQSPRGTAFSRQSDAVDLRSPASNITTQLQLPDDRWPLFALGRGAGVGPAMLYWGELLAFLVVAMLLGRWQHSPLRRYEWLLLGIGLSTLSWFVFVLVAAWLFAFRWRAQLSPESMSRRRFNVAQIALAALAFFAITSLIFSGIRYGFLSTPDMGIVGAGSGGSAFSWFRDQTSGALPQPLVLSAPMWLYKTLIFAWAGWIAIALTRWIRSAWECWTHGGFWRGGTVKVAA